MEMLLRSQWFLFYQTCPKRLICDGTGGGNGTVLISVNFLGASGLGHDYMYFLLLQKPNNKEDRVAADPHATPHPSTYFLAQKNPFAIPLPDGERMLSGLAALTYFHKKEQGKICRRRGDLCSSTAGIIKSPHVHDVPGRRGRPSGADNESGQTGATRRVTRGESFTSACPLCRRRSARRKGCRSSPSASSARCTPAPRWSFNTAAKGLASAKFSRDDQSTTRLRFHFLNTHGSHYLFLFF